MKRGLTLLAPLLVSAVPAPGGEVVVSVSGLRSAKGQVLACLTARAKGFPDCAKDPAARKLAGSAARGMTLTFVGIPPGTYAVSLLHDENGNGRADMALMLPREGFGFSRDATLRLGPPKFARAAFAVRDRAVAVPITMRYFFR